MAKKVLPYALAQFFIVAFQWMAMLFLPLFFKAQGLSDARIGVLISIFSLATLLLIFPLGVLADRLPPRPMMQVAALLIGAFAALMPRAHGFYAWAAGTFIAGAGFTLASISLYSLFFKQVGQDRRGGEVGLFSIGGIMGGGMAAWISGQLSFTFHDPEIIFPLALLFALAFVAITLFLPRTRGLAFPILEYGRDLKELRTWVLIGLMFVTSSHSGVEQAGYTLLQTEVLKLSTVTVGQIFLVIAVWMSISTAWTGKRFDHEPRPLLMMGLGLVMSGVFMAASGSAQGPYDFLIYRLLHTGGDSVLMLLTLVLASFIFPKHRAGGAFAFALTVNTAAYFLFANLTGVVAGRWGFDTAFHLSGLILTTGGVVLLIARPRLRKLFKIEEGNLRPQ